MIEQELRGTVDWGGKSIVRKIWISQEMSGRPTGEESGVALHDEIE